MKCLFVLSLFIVLVGCQDSTTHLISITEAHVAIHHGQDVITPEFSSVVAIGFLSENSSYRHLCTGTVIAENWILTAAHCAEDVDKDQAVILFGNDVKKAPTDLRKIHQWIVHPDWNPLSVDDSDAKNTADLALIQFSGGLPHETKPALLVPPRSMLKKDDSFTIAGFGFIEEPVWNGQELIGNMPWGEGVLRATTLLVDKEFSETEVLSDETETGSAYGDSGGPGFITIDGKTYLTAVISRGLYNVDGIYTQLSPYLPWIKSQIR